MPDSNLGPKWRHLARVLRGEQATTKAARKALAALLEYAAGALASAGYDVSHLSAQASGWTKAASATVLPAIEEVFLSSFNAAGQGIIDPAPYATRHMEAVANRLAGVPDDVFDTVRVHLEEGRRLSEGIPQLAARVDALLTDTQRWDNRAVTIARTETIGAANAGAVGSAYATADLLGYESGDVAKTWLATGDGRTRETHQDADGQTVMGLDTSFDVGGYDLDQPGDPFGPPEEVVNCVVGSTQVAWPGQVVHAVTSRDFTGEFIELRTARGHHLTVTPNHPVLTPLGYLAAQHLRVGQQVLATSAPPPPEVQDGPPSIEQVHRAALEAGAARRVGGRRMDFHGDGSEAEVEVVRPHRDLTLDGDAERLREMLEGVLVRLDDRQRPLPLSRRGQRRAKAARIRDRLRDDSRTAGLVGSRSAPTPVLWGQAGGGQSGSLATGTHGEAEFPEPPYDERAADAEVARHLEHALALGMTPCEVIEVKRYAGTHRVFNLQTSDAWYVGAGVAQHNCRCTVLFSYPGDPDYPTDAPAPVVRDSSSSGQVPGTAPAPAAPLEHPTDPGPQTDQERMARALTLDELVMEMKRGSAGAKAAARAELRRRGFPGVASGRVKAALRAAGQEQDMAENEETRTGVVVVALPAADDPVRGIGLEDKHCTLLYFGDVPGGETPNDLLTPEFRTALSEAIATAAAAQDPTREAQVQGVESLGAEGARVWMLDGPPMTDLRAAVQDAGVDVDTALAGVEQYPTYTPHVTIGYADVEVADAAPSEDVTVEGQLDPETEAAAAEVSTITFDRLALWWAGEQTEWPLAAPAEETPMDDPTAAAMRAAIREEMAAAFAQYTSGLVAAEGDPLPGPDGSPAPSEEPPATASEIPTDGPPLYGILWPEGVQSGDARAIEAGATTWRDLPLPLMAQDAQAMGHDGAVRVARIDTIERDNTTYSVPVLRYTGVWDSSPIAAETMRQVDAGVARGVSVDGDAVTVELRGSDGAPLDPMVDDFPADGVVVEVATAARIAGATACSVPAFQQAYVANGTLADRTTPEPGWNEDGTPKDNVIGQPPEGETEVGDQPLTEPVAASAAPAWSLTAAAGPEWASRDFANPGLTEPTRLTITDDGRVYGHLATWGICHIGIDGICQEPPVSATNYAYFATGAVPTDAGYASVGQLTMETGHAGMNLGHRAAVAHYDNTGTAVCDVAMGQDDVGIWYAGRLRPGTTPEQVYAMRAAGSVSGDWREVGGQLELVAALVVNVPGFPIPAPSIAASGTRPVAMVASGVVRPTTAPAKGTPDEAALHAAVETVLANRERQHRALVASTRIRRDRAAAAALRLTAQRRARATAAAARLTER